MKVERAGENITALRALRKEADGLVYIADSSNVSHMTHVYGISRQSVSIGTDLNVIIFGEFIDTGLLFAGEIPIFINGAGVLSTTPPSTGFIIDLGYMSDANTMFVNIQEPTEIC